MVIEVPTATVLQAGAMIQDRLGIGIFAQMRAMLDDLLLKLSQGDIPTYIEALSHAPETDPIWQSLIRELTIGETYFLRDRSHFQLIQSHILPQMIEKHRQSNRLTLNIWSAGCATGEEAYSLAVTAFETIPDIDQWHINIVATDVNAEALRIARRGIYRHWAFRHTDLDFQGEYFDQTPKGLQIKPHIKRMVTFRQTNLLAPQSLPTMDLILCRNVLIYFSKAHTRRAEHNFYSQLTPEGWLLLGHSEAIQFEREKWQTHLFPGTPPAYQKTSNTDNTAGARSKSKTYSHQILDATHIDAVIEADEIAIRYNRAVIAMRDDDHALALEEITALQQYAPNFAPTYLLSASLSANEGHSEDAFRSIDIALELNPLFADAHYLRASLLMEQSDMTGAQRALQSALYCQRGHPLASFLLGNLHAQAGEITPAMRHWRTAQHTISNLTAETLISDISDMSVAQLQKMVNEQLAGWQT